MAGELHFMGTIDNSQFLKGIQQMQDGIKEVTETTEAEGQAMEALVQKIGQAAAAMGVGFSAVSFIKQVVQTRGEFQALEASFRTLIGSEEEANALMQQLTKTAASTPFDLKGIADGAKQLMAYGESAENVNDKLVELGNIASGLSLPLSDLVTLYGTTVSKANMDTLDLKQFKSRGIAIDEAIAEVMKVTKEDVPKLITAGQVTGDIVKQAIETMANGTGKFAGMMSEQSKTILGQISNIGDAFDMMLNEIGQSNEGLISDTLKGVSYVIENYEKIGEEIAKIIAAYGVYKGVLISVAAYNQAMVAQEATALKAVLATKKEELSADLERAVASKAITKEKALEIEAMRKEAAQRVATLKLTAEQAAAEMALAKQQLESIGLRTRAAANAVAMAEMELKAAVNRGEATAIENAEIQLNEALNRKDAAAREWNAAQANLQAKASASNAAALNYENTRMAVASAAQTSMTKSTKMLALAQQALGKIMKATGLSMLANPYVLAATAIAAACYGLYKVYDVLTEKSRKVKEAQDDVNKSFGQTQSKIVTEVMQLEKLNAQLQNAKKGTEEYEDAKKQIIDQYGSYKTGLDTEIDKLVEENRLVNVLTESIKKRYMEESKAKAMQKAYDTYSSDTEGAQERIYKMMIERAEEKLKSQGVGKNTKEYARIIDNVKGYYQEVVRAIQKGQIELEGNVIKGISDEANAFLQEKSKELRTTRYGNETTREFVDVWKNVLADEVEDLTEANEMLQTQIRYIDDVYVGINETKKDAGRLSQSAEVSKEEAKTLREVQTELKKEEANLKEYQAKFAAGELHDNGMEGNLKKMVSYADKVKATQEKIKELKQTIQDMGGEDEKTARNKAKDAQERAQALAKAQAARLALEEQYTQEGLEHTKKQYREAQQLEIDLMKEGTEKRLKQRELDYLKELDQAESEGETLKKSAIEQARQLFNADQDIKAAGDKDYVKKEFDETAYVQGMSYAQIEQAIDENVSKAMDNVRQRRAKEDEAFWAEELSKNKEYAEKYLSILIQSKQKERNIDRNVALSRYSQEEGDKLKQMNAQQLTETLAANGMSKEDLLSTFTGFTDLAAKVVEGNVKEVISKYEELYEAMDEAQKNTPQGVAVLAAITAARNAVDKAVDDSEPDKTDMEKWEMYEGAINQCVDAGMQLAETMGAGTDETGKQIMRLAIQTQGIVSNVMRFINESIEGIKAAETAGVTALKAIEAASVILLIIDAIIQVTQAIVALVKQEGPLEKFKRDIMDLNDKIRDLKREMYLNEGLNDTIFDANLWADMVDNGRKSTEKMGEYVQKVREMMATQFVDGGRADTTGLKIKSMFKTGKSNATLADYTGVDIEEIKDFQGALNAMGKALGSVQVQTRHSTWFRKAQYKSLQDLNPDLYNADGSINMDALKEFQSTETYKHLSEDQRGYIEEMVEAWEDYETATENLTNALKDQFSSLGSTLGDAIEQAFLKGEIGAEDFRTAVADKMNDLAKQMTLSLVYGDMFERYSEEFKKIYTDQSYDNNETRMAAFVEAASRMTDEAVEGMDEAVNIYGSVVDMINQKIGQTSVQVEQEQKANYGGYETISEETGSELSGRATAMYLVQSEHLEVARTMLDTISNSAAVVNNINITVGGLAVTAAQQLQTQNAILSVVRTYTEEAGASLANIAKYTKNLG